MNSKSLEVKRHFVNNKIIIGIDPGKKNHQAIIINSMGIPLCKSFKFSNNYHGFHLELWKKLEVHIKDFNCDNIIFAVEISINLWQKLCAYLTEKGYTTLMVSPLYTKHERPKMDNTYSKSDPKDSLAVANCARQGYFNFYKEYSPKENAMHRLSITYDKLRKHMAQTKQRIRSQIELIFPEFLNALDIDTDSARYLLRNYLTPDDFLKMNVFREAPHVGNVLQRQHGAETLKRIKQAAHKSIGIKITEDQLFAEKLTLNCWLIQYALLREQMDNIIDQLVSLAEQTPYFDIITSLKGISDITTSRFIAELRDLSYFNHYKKIEAFSGISLKLSQSGKYTGYRRITHIGNHRLRALLYKMSEETKNHIPEIRIRYIKRQMKQSRYKKNVTACISNLLKLIVAMIKENNKYEYKEDKQDELKEIEKVYKEFKNNNKKKHTKTA